MGAVAGSGAVARHEAMHLIRARLPPTLAFPYEEVKRFTLHGHDAYNALQLSND